MALSDKKKAKVSADIEAGLLTKTKIANKHKINRLTLYNLIERDGLIYGKNKQKINDEVSEKSLENIIAEEIDKATKMTSQFLKDSDEFRELVMMVASELRDAYKEAQKKTDETGEKVKVSKDEFDRIFAGSKIMKINLESLNMQYSGTRKALGMDRDDDVEKAHRIKQADKQQNIDPTEGLTEESVDKQLEEYDK